MCLLITKTVKTPPLADHWLEDFYLSNSDGIGVMYAKDNQLVIKKLLPKSAAELIDFYRAEIDNKNCAVHFRMRTHGDIDLFNCHPYEVLNKSDHGVDLWLMHNGILSTGNSADTKKSDTWHYIKNYLKPLLASNPDIAFSEPFRAVIGAHIGLSNKFVLMDNKGRQSVINQSSGVFWAGMWLSNTYAWTAPKDTTKQRIKNLKLWKQQAQSTIQKVQKYNYKYFDYDYDENYNNGYAYYKNTRWGYNYIAHSDQVEIQACIDDLRLCGYDEVVNLSPDQIEDFIYLNRISSFYDLYESLINCDITENVFIDLIANPSRYKDYVSSNKQGLLL
jgi:hypothetical protein